MWTGQPNQPLRQPMTAAMLVWRGFLSFSAAAAAEPIRYPPKGATVFRELDVGQSALLTDLGIIIVEPQPGQHDY